jgi:hypothetical protein
MNLFPDMDDLDNWWNSLPVCPVCFYPLEIVNGAPAENGHITWICPYCGTSLAVHNGAIALDVATEPEYVKEVTE